MTADSPSPRRVAIIGGGCAGLAAAHHIAELASLTRVSVARRSAAGSAAERRATLTRVTLFEASDRLGGVIRTERCGDYLVEHGADMFTTKDPWALDLCRRLGLESELISTNTKYARAFVIHRGRLCPVPEGFALMTPGQAWPILRTPVLSLRGKLRMAWEYFIPRRIEDSDESLADFVTRRLGQEAYERLVQPLISGIYTADPHQLSMQAALPQFVEMERKHGGLLRGVRHARSSGDQVATQSTGARYGLFVAPRSGMQMLVDKLIASLSPDTIQLRSPVRSMKRLPNGSWSLTTQAGTQSEHFDAVILATPASAAGDLLIDTDPTLANELREIPYASASIVVCGYERRQIRHPLDGFGVVAPLIEKRRILAASFASVKFPGRAPDGRVLMRIFVGGACQPELARLPDGELQQLAVSELKELLGANGPPELCKIVRWEKAMPQYHVGHGARVRRIEQRIAAFPNLALAGNAYRGVGIPHCIHSGEQAAEKVVQFLSLVP